MELSVRLGKPELIVPATKITHKTKHLSDIDDQGSLRFQSPILMFYKCSPSMEGKDPAKVLRDGLSKALVFYYPLAGRIVEGPNRKLMVNCNSEGVLFIEADANVELEELGDSIKPPCPYLDQLLYNVPGSDGIIGCPLFLFQVTRFSCGGFTVGIRCNHTMMDGYGLKLFLNAVIEFTRGASAPPIIPVWQRHLLSARSTPRVTCVHNEFDEQFESRIVWESIEDKLIQRSFFFGKNEMEAIKDQVSSNHRSSKTFEQLTAFLWRCRTIAIGLHPEEIVHLTYFANARERSFNFKLPLGYYGNAVITPGAVTKAGLLCTNPLSYAIELVKKVKDQMSEEYVRSVADLMVIKGRPEWTKSWNFVVSDNRYTGVDEFDIGWGKPILSGVARAVSSISIYLPFVNAKAEKGILVPISLPPPAMEKFQDLVHNMTSQKVEGVHITSMI